MTDDDILTHPATQRFLQNFARYCGAPRSVFEGQFTRAVRALLDAEYEQLRAALARVEQRPCSACCTQDGDRQQEKRKL